MNGHLQRYFKRIGYEGNAVSNLETLQNLCRLHTQTFSFENLNPLVGLPVEVDDEWVINKMVDQQRGGYCFEQNILFSYMLQVIGFQVKRIPGRVLIDQPEDVITSQTHMLNWIVLDGKVYIADVGFGSASLASVIEFRLDVAQTTPFEDYRIVDRGQFYLLQYNIAGEWNTLYRFTTDEWPFIDYKVANWYTSAHPDSHFTTTLSMSIMGEGCKYTLKDNLYRIYRVDGENERRILSSVGEIREILESVFKIRLPKNVNLDEVLKSLLKTS